MKKAIENIMANYFAGEASAEDIAFVEKFKKSHPDTFAAWQKAFALPIYGNIEIDNQRAKERVVATIKREKVLTKSRRMQMWLKVAALFAGLLIVGAAFYFYTQSQPVVYENNTAQLMNLTLPDGSEVTLDKNATLSYNKTFWGNFQREVNMSGRAAFHVTKDAAHPFRVNSSSVSVTVLGTRFTVNELSDHTQVFLIEGKVRVESNLSKKKRVITKPGEQIILNSNGILRQNRINPNLYASWTSNKVHFNNCTVAEVVQFLDDSYGVDVDITDKNMLKRELYGSAPTDDEQLIIDALSQILQTDIKSK